MKRLLAILMAALMLVIPSVISAAADEANNAEEQEKAMKEAEAFFMESFTMSKEQFFDKLEVMESNDVYGKLEWEVPTAVDSVALLNYEYDRLIAEFKLAGFGEKNELVIPKFEQGYAENIKERFDEKFGTIVNRDQKVATLPNGWTFEEIVADSAAARDERFSDIRNNPDFVVASNLVTQRISIGDCFAAANEELKMPALNLNKIANLSQILDAPIDEHYDWREKFPAYFDVKVKDIENPVERYWEATKLAFKDAVEIGGEKNGFSSGSLLIFDSLKEEYSQYILSQYRIQDSDTNDEEKDAYRSISEYLGVSYTEAKDMLTQGLMQGKPIDEVLEELGVPKGYRKPIDIDGFMSFDDVIGDMFG